MSKDTQEYLRKHPNDATAILEFLLKVQAENAALEKSGVVHLHALDQITSENRRLEAENNRLRKKLSTVENQRKESASC